VALDGSGAAGRTASFILRVTAQHWRASVVQLLPEARYRFAVAPSRSRRTFVWFGQLVVRPNTSLRIHAPVVIVSSGGHRRILLARDELTLPAKSRTKVGMLNIEAHRLFHTYPVVPASGLSPAACKMQRSTAARAIGILYAFCPRLFAGLIAA
jgi:hypothetical protein